MTFSQSKSKAVALDSEALQYFRKPIMEYYKTAYLQNMRKMILSELPNGRTIAIRYKEDVLFRTVNPYAAYESSPGNIVLATMQLNDPNKEASEPGWRDFAIKDITDVIFSDDQFEPASDFKPNAARFCSAISTIQISNKELN